MSVLSVQGVWKSYGDRAVLRGIDLEVAAHEVVALIGASGSGKSTLLKTIDLLERVDDGRILLGGDDITDPRADPDGVRARIGVVFQSYNLFPHRTILDNVTLGLRAVHRVPRDEATRRGAELLERVGLADHASAYPDRLSGGQQQRAAIARAVAAGPELLLLDEVTSALDPLLVGEVLELVRELMAFARDVADRVVFLDAGEVCEQGPPAQVLGAPREPRTRAFLARFLPS